MGLDYPTICVRHCRVVSVDGHVHRLEVEMDVDLAYCLRLRRRLVSSLEGDYTVRSTHHAHHIHGIEHRWVGWCR